MSNLYFNNYIVWDLYSEGNCKSIYVGQGKWSLEYQALCLYENNDLQGTKERRSKQYGYKDNQPIIDKIFSYGKFIVRILYIGSNKECRALESVWNNESNNGEGCIIKQIVYNTKQENLNDN